MKADQIDILSSWEMMCLNLSSTQPYNRLLQTEGEIGLFVDVVLFNAMHL